MDMSDWIPVREAKVDGAKCELRFRDPLGSYEVEGPFFLHDDGHWYRIEPPMKLTSNPTHFRPL
jgi:hypothetical protein